MAPIVDGLADGATFPTHPSPPTLERNVLDRLPMQPTLDFCHKQVHHDSVEMAMHNITSGPLHSAHAKGASYILHTLAVLTALHHLLIQKRQPVLLFFSGLGSEAGWILFSHLARDGRRQYFRIIRVPLLVKALDG